MRILTRYILREVTSHALLGGVLFTFVLFMRDLGQILELVVRDSASLTDVLRIIVYILPNVLTVTIPMAVLVGILLGLSRLAADSEITAMRACGMGALDFVRIVSIVSAVALALGLVNSPLPRPRAAAGLLRLERPSSPPRPPSRSSPASSTKTSRTTSSTSRTSVPATGAALWRHVFLADLTQPATPHVTTADQAVVVTEHATPRRPDPPPPSHSTAASTRPIPTTPTSTTSPPSPPPISPSKPEPRRTPTSAATTPPSSPSPSPNSCVASSS